MFPSRARRTPRRRGGRRGRSREELDDVPRKLVALVDLGRARRDPLARELAHEVADLALLVGERLVATDESLCSAVVILENGVVRTLEPTLPGTRAGDRRRPGRRRGRRPRDALATPDRVDLGGRCVLPGLHRLPRPLPTWSLAQRQVRLGEPRPWRRRSSDRGRHGPRSSPAAGSAGPAGASGDWTPAWSRRRKCSTASPGTRPPR